MGHDVSPTRLLRPRPASPGLPSRGRPFGLLGPPNAGWAAAVAGLAGRAYTRAPRPLRRGRRATRERSAMRSAKPLLPPAQVGFLQMRVRSVDGSLVALNLLATDHRIVIGQDCDYLIGNGVAHAFSKEGLFLRSGAVPAILQDLHTLGGATRVEPASAG